MWRGLLSIYSEPITSEETTHPLNTIQEVTGLYTGVMVHQVLLSHCARLLRFITAPTRSIHIEICPQGQGEKKWCFKLAHLGSHNHDLQHAFCESIHIHTGAGLLLDLCVTSSQTFTMTLIVHMAGISWGRRVSTSSNWCGRGGMATRLVKTTRTLPWC